MVKYFFACLLIVMLAFAVHIGAPRSRGWSKIVYPDGSTMLEHRSSIDGKVDEWREFNPDGNETRHVVWSMSSGYQPL